MTEQQHTASTEFWAAYTVLPQPIRARADKQFAVLTENTQHPSLQFKKLGERNGHEVWSDRVTLQCRAGNQATRWVFVVLDR